MAPFARLPTSVRPSKYTLHYDHLDMPGGRFTGSAAIDIDVLESGVSSITLHAVDMWVRSAFVTTCNADKLKLRSTKYDQDQQSATLNFGTELPTGKATLSISFQGELNDKMCGLYRSKYKVDGEDRYMAVTQFEATDARRAFPCWDEPAIKAKFEVSVTTPSNLICVSNTPLRRSQTNSKAGTKEWYFYETPIMSTYLVAMVVGEFDCVSERSPQGILTNVYTPLGKANQGEFALKVASKALDYYQEVFGVAYPLPKSDLLAIPDFAAGAMENWGCVTYRETKLLIDEQISSQTSILGSARTVCHELAHQWFGNLVTMEWWSDLWLNEGFARYMEFIATDRIFPERDVWTTFVQDVQSLGLQKDSLLSSHPVYVEVGHPDEVNEIFDSISYAKGASLICMLQEYVGSDQFMRGVRAYLAKFAYSNATTSDLWKSIEDANKMESGSVSNMMNSWLTQMGYPVVRVLDSSKKSKTKFKISCDRYLEQYPETPKKLNQEWPLPVNVAWRDPSSNSIVSKYFMVSKSDELQALCDQLATVHEAGGVCVLNHGSFGFFRTLYLEEQYLRIAKLAVNELGDAGAIDTGSKPNVIMTRRNRLGIVRDAFVCARNGKISLAVALRLAIQLMFGSTEAFKSGKSVSHWVESDPFVLLQIVSNVLALGNMVRGTDVFEKFAIFAQRVCAPLMNRLGWESTAGSGANPVEASLRPVVLRASSLVSSSAIDEEAAKRFNQHCDGSKPLAGDMRPLVFKIAASTGNSATYEQLLERYRDPQIMPDERRETLVALASFSQDDLVQRAFTFVIESGEVRQQDLAFPLNAICSGPFGAQLVWNHVRENWSWWWNKLGAGGNFVWASVMGVVVRGLQTQEQAKQVESFFADDTVHPLGSAARAVTQALESVRLKVARVERALVDLPAFLQEALPAVSNGPIVSGECKLTLDGHRGRVRTLIKCEGGKVCTGSSDNTIIVWDSKTWNKLATLEGHTSSVRALASRNNVLFSCSNDNTIRVWDLESFKCVHVLVSGHHLDQGHGDKIHTLELCGDKLLSTSGTSIMIWGRPDGGKVVADNQWSAIGTMGDHEWSVLSLHCFKMAKVGTVVAAGYRNGDIVLRKADSWEVVANVVGAHSDKVWGFANLEHGLLASCSGDGVIKVFDVSSTSFKCVRTLERHINTVRSLLVCSKSGAEFLVSASDDRTIKVFNTQSWQCVQTFSGHKDGVRAILRIDDQLLSASYDGTIKVWDW